jgi:hypothetical protein
VVTLSTPGSFIMRASKRRATASVCWMVAALGQPQVDQDLRPARVGEELLLHLAHAGDAQREGEPPCQPMVIQRCCTHQSTRRRKRL